MITCEGCGFEHDQLSGVDTKVNLRDGMPREIQFCDVVCVDFWKDQEAGPGDWAELASGEEVQRAIWTCQNCIGTYDYTMVQLLVDTHDYDPDDHISEYNPGEIIVCDECVKACPGRFKTRREIGL